MFPPPGENCSHIFQISSLGLPPLPEPRPIIPRPFRPNPGQQGPYGGQPGNIQKYPFGKVFS